MEKPAVTQTSLGEAADVSHITAPLNKAGIRGAVTPLLKTGISPQKLAANRRNAQLSTGPRTEEGKSRSRHNALKHGILGSAVLITSGEGAEDPAEFDELLSALRRDLAPVGRLEEMMVEKIAVCWWRQKRSLRCETGLIRRDFVPRPEPPTYPPLEKALQELVSFTGYDPRPIKHIPELDAIKDHRYLPLGEQLDQILRYETTIQRQRFYAINQLERLQRARKGEHIPAPVNVQVSTAE